MELFISSATHPGGLDGDPFATTPFLDARPTAQVQSAGDIAFLQRVLSGGRAERAVNYFVMGAGVWKKTQQWPPAGVHAQALQFSRSGLAASGGAAGEVSYVVDPTATSGPLNRWASQTASPIYYGDRRQAPGRRLSFDAAPVRADLELVGAPELCLAMRTDQPDGFVGAYLEDVAPDGRVTYLTEGVLRLLHRKTQGKPCDPASDTRRSFARADAAPVTPGELMQVEIPMQPTAALIQKGHHLRLSLAGADAGTFSTLTGDKTATWSVAFGAGGSSLRLPLKAWSAR